MTPVQVAFYSGPGFVHALIKAFTRQPVSHCEVVLFGSGYTPKHKHTGLYQRHGGEYRAEHWQLFPVFWDPTRVSEYLHAHRHKGYDLRSLAAHVLPIHDAIGRQNCAEFVVNVGSFCGDPRFHNQPGWRFTPGDVLDQVRG